MNVFSSTAKIKAAKAAATVLSNMFQYKKLHKDYKQVGDTKNELYLIDWKDQ